MLTLNNIEVVYKEIILVLRGVSMTVPEEGVVSLIGANGSGKSTLLKAVSGFLGPEEGKITKGEIRWQERRIDGTLPETLARRGLIHVMQGHRVFEELTVMENLLMGARRHRDRGTVRREIERVLELFPGLEPLLSRRAGYLSGGEQQMLVLGRALLAAPQLLLLDEPLMGLSPFMTGQVLAIIRDVGCKGDAAVLLVEQNAIGALKISTYGYVLENGRIVADGPSEWLLEHPDVKTFYLGLSEEGEKQDPGGIKYYKRRKRWLI